MAKSRFESYVEERIGELAAGRRAKLKAAYDEEVAKVERQRDKYLGMVEDGVEALVRKVVAQAKRGGCAVGETEDAATSLSEYARTKIRRMVGLKTEYDCNANRYRWPEGSPAWKAQDALEAFDALCAKEAKRITVYKMDLGMKPEAFERMLAETAAKINRE